MTLGQEIRRSITVFNANDIEDGYLETNIILGHILNLPTSQLYSQPELLLTSEQIAELQQLIERRLCREPTAYITRRKEFYEIDFYVDSRVLIPRPETELIVDVAIDFVNSHAQYQSFSKRPFLIADIGTGCGSIAISLALNLPQSKIYATDISSAALEVAQLNCKYYNITKQITLLNGNLLEPLPEPVDLIVANLPYIKSSEIANLSPETTNYEPRIAIDGGINGLNQINDLLQQVKEMISPQGCLLLEIGYDQEIEVISLINQYLPNAKLSLIPDYNEVNRVVCISF